LLLAVVVGAGLRFWQLGNVPHGIYRDEAYNGLDALAVLRGEHALFFSANNGREPAYIYLTALAVALFGPTALAVRIGAAVIGSLTSLVVYQLGRAWFTPQVGLLAAWLWAVTLWPVHLSRIGLRVIWLPLVLALFFWLITLAYRRQQQWLWLLAGIVYGAGFYTYLAFRFTPLLLAALFIYLLWQGPRPLPRPWPRWRSGLLWFSLGFGITILPFVLLVWQQPELFLGRSGQVSLLNPDIHGGDLPGALLRQMGATLGLFFWQGDTILRHNPLGRPLFDWLMAGPFIAGVVWTARHWRQPAAAALLLWTGIMLGPTILAEDAPHFLRAAGILPATLVFPAITLSHLWTWSTLPNLIRRSLVILLLTLSLGLTLRDYTAYGQQPDTGYLFESAATQLAAQLNNASPAADIWLDQRYWDGWPSIRFLAHDVRLTRFTSPADLALTKERVAEIYVWPYEDTSFLAAALPLPGLIVVEVGPLARGDLEPTPYPLFVHYTFWPDVQVEQSLANFNNEMELHQAQVTAVAAEQLAVTLVWTADQPTQSLVAFVHVLGDSGLIGQHDSPPGLGYWAASWWRPGLQLREQREIQLSQPYDPTQHSIVVGLYPAHSPEQRLPVWDPGGAVVGDGYTLP
jgi:4-amino-4-deoxy-L-arabinose transferase-like glycosyltransferase